MENSKSSAFLDGLFGFFSFILSFVFVVTAFVLMLAYSISGILQPKAVAKIIQNVDYVEVIKESDDMNKIFEEMDMDAETVDEIIKSDAGKSLVKDFSDKTTTIILDDDSDLNDIDDRFFKDIVDDHIDDLLVIAEEQKGSSVEKEKLKDALHEAIDKNSESIDGLIKSLEPIKTSGAVKVVKVFYLWNYALLAWVVEGAILALIYLMKKKNYSGFIWIAVNTGIVGALTTAVALIAGSKLVSNLLSDMPNFIYGIAISAKNKVVTNLIIGLSVCFAVMIASIIACVLLRAREKKIATQQQVEPITIEPQEMV